MSRSIKDYIIIGLKGIAMGAADVVPGVSGGTIAFISGIYEELIESIKSINFKSIKTLFKKGFKSFWSSVNGFFLSCLVLGILISVLSLAKLLHYLLDNYPIFIWSFFFGLIVASAIYVAMQMKSINGGISMIIGFATSIWIPFVETPKSDVTLFFWLFALIYLLSWGVAYLLIYIVTKNKNFIKVRRVFFSGFSINLGILISYLITTITPVADVGAPSYFYLFICGVIAICAMILPGISGSFILLLMGQYKFVLEALSSLKISYIGVLGLGAAIGLISFSNVLSWLLRKFHDITVAFLAGFMIGSLNKVWPWKHALLSHADKYGNIVHDKLENVMPHNFYSLTGKDPQTFYAILMAITGFLVIFLLQSTFNRIKSEEAE